MLITKIKWTRK